MYIDIHTHIDVHGIAEVGALTALEQAREAEAASQNFPPPQPGPDLSDPPLPSPSPPPPMSWSDF